MSVILARANKINMNQKGESLVENIDKSLAILEELWKSISFKEEDKLIITIICICHDLGKINSVTQRKLYIYSNIYKESNKEKIKEANESEEVEEKKRKIKEINNLKVIRHNILSGAFLKMILDKIALSKGNKEIIYKTVMFHHGGCEDYIDITETKLQEDIYNFIEEGIFNSEEYELRDIEEYINNAIHIDFKFDKELLDYDYIVNLNESLRTEEKRVEYILYKGVLNLVDYKSYTGENYTVTLDKLLLSMFKFPGYEKIFAKVKGTTIIIENIELFEPKMFSILLYFMDFARKYLDVDFHLNTDRLSEVYKEEIMKKNIVIDYGRKTHKNKVLNLKCEKDMMDKCYENEDFERYCRDEFINCNKIIKNIYGINKENFTGSDLILKFEPYKNLEQNKKEISKIFTYINEICDNFIEEDFEEI